MNHIQVHSLKAVTDPVSSSKKGPWRCRPSWASDERTVHQVGRERMARLRWYLEEYPRLDPLNSGRATRAETELEEEGKNMLEELIYDLPECKTLDIYDEADDSSFFALPWELLERTERPCNKAGQTIIRRRVSCRAATTAPTEPSSNAFNILLLAARAEGTDNAEYRQVGLPLLEITQNLRSAGIDVNLELVRPGTYKALVHHLQRAREKGNRFHLVHLDVHGRVSLKNGAKLVFANDELVNSKVLARLLQQHGVTYVVLNACESARSDIGLKANLAKQFICEGIPIVLAMSYQLNISAVPILVKSFYCVFLRDGFPFSEAAALARVAMAKDSVRKGRFGINMKLHDWIVPVVYASSDHDPVVLPLRSVVLRGPKQPFIQSSWTTPCYELPGRDLDILRIETMLMTNAQDGRGRLFLIDGKLGVGKTTLLQHLQTWWTLTGMISHHSVYVDFRECSNCTPETVCGLIINKLRSNRGVIPARKSPRMELFDLLDSLLDVQHNEPGLHLYPRPLLVFDHFPALDMSMVRPQPLGSIWCATWKSFLQELESKGSAYTIVASHRLPWYIDDHHTSEFPCQIYYDLPPAHLSFVDMRRMASWDASLPTIPKRPEDNEKLDILTRWCAVAPALAKAVTCLIKNAGLDDTMQLILMGKDILSQSKVDSRAIKEHSAYKAAKIFWKTCTSTERMILIGFAPFHEYLPRCLVSYCRGFQMKQQAATLGSRKAYIIKPSRRSQHRLAMGFMLGFGQLEGDLEYLIPILKGLGLIKGEDMLGPSTTDEGWLDSMGQPLSEGTRLYSIHPVFSIFLRHQGEKPRLLSWGKEIRKVNLLYRNVNFVEYHETRAEEWMRQEREDMEPWDRLLEADKCHLNFLVAADIRLNTPIVRYHNDPIPVFLIWCYQDRSKNIAHDTLVKHSLSAWKKCVRRLEKLRVELDSALSNPAQEDSLSVIQRTGDLLGNSLLVCIWLARYRLCFGHEREFSDQVSDGKALVRVLTESKMRILKLLCPHLPLVWEDFQSLCHVHDEIDMNPAGAWLRYLQSPNEELSGRASSHEGWPILERSISLVDEITLLRSKAAKLEFWDIDSRNTQLALINDRVNEMLSDLAQLWPGLLSSVDDDLLLRFRLLGFDETDDLVEFRDPQFYEMLEEGDEEIIPSRRLIPPNYGCQAMAALRRGEGIQNSLERFEREWQEWKRVRARKFCLFILKQSLEGVNEAQRSLMERYQSAILGHMDNWDELYRHMDLLALKERSQPVKALARRDVETVTNWHNLKALCALKTSEWQTAHNHLMTALVLASTRPDIAPSFQFQSLRTYISLVLEMPATAQVDTKPIWDPLLQALILGYATDNKNVYARNGSLLSILLGGKGFHSEDDCKIHIMALLEFVIPSRKPIIDISQGTAAYMKSARRGIKSGRRAMPQFPQARKFLHTLTGLLTPNNIERSRNTLSEAENHLFTHAPNCGCPYDAINVMSDTSSSLGTDFWEILIRKLPDFDIRVVEQNMVSPQLLVAFNLAHIWIYNKFRISAPIMPEDFAVSSLRYLARFHEAARD